MNKKEAINMNNIMIISQNKKTAINYNNIFALEIRESYYKGTLTGYEIAAKNVGTGFFTALGSYSWEYRCVEVFNEITDKIIRGVGCIEMPER